jgi:hypothetical protein
MIDVFPGNRSYLQKAAADLDADPDLVAKLRDSQPLKRIFDFASTVPALRRDVAGKKIPAEALEDVLVNLARHRAALAAALAAVDAAIADVSSTPAEAEAEKPKQKGARNGNRSGRP